MSYYINMGRWASSVVGPFETQDAATRYIDQMDWRGAPPTIVTVAPPLVKRHKYRIAIRRFQAPLPNPYTYVEGEGVDVFDAWSNVADALDLDTKVFGYSSANSDEVIE